MSQKMSSGRGRGRGRGRGGGRGGAPADAGKSSLAEEWQNSLGGKKKAHAFAKFLATIEEDAVGEGMDVSILREVRSALSNFHNGREVDGSKPTSSNSTAKPPDSQGWVTAKEQPAEVVKRLVKYIEREFASPPFPLSFQLWVLFPR